MPPSAPLLVETVKDVTVVSIQDASLVDGRIIDAVQKDLLDMVEKRARRRMIVDFSSVKFLSSAALGMLLTLHKAIGERRGLLVLCGLRTEIAKMFKLSGLHKFFTVKKDEKKALQDFGVFL
ncbi:MAG: STAS domain-containing protein [Phycisphaerae bacterium]